MAAIGTVTVPVRVSIDRETAETCARLVEMYVNQEGAELVVRRTPDGRFTLSMVERDRDDS